MDKLEVLIGREELRKRIAELAAEISAEYRGDSVVLLVVLKGAYIFAADLSRELTVDMTVDFVQTSSYGNAMSSSGEVSMVRDTNLSLVGKNVLIVEDICDTANTLTFLKKHMENRGAKTIKTVCLLDKPSRRVVPMKCDYVGFEVEDLFLVGFGLDYAQKYRNLPDICVYKG